MPDGATVGELRQLLEATLKVPYADQTLSLDQRLVRPVAAASAQHAMPAHRAACAPGPGAAPSRQRVRLLTLARVCPCRPQLLAPEPSAFRDMASERATLASLGVGHGSLLYFRYSVQRVVTPNAVPVETRPFGAHMTVAEMVLKQVRVERQEKPRCASLSFDGQAANVFQACVPRARSAHAPRPQKLTPPRACHPQLREPGARVLDPAGGAAVRHMRRGGGGLRALHLRAAAAGAWYICCFARAGCC